MAVPLLREKPSIALLSAPPSKSLQQVCVTTRMRPPRAARSRLRHVGSFTAYAALAGGLASTVPLSRRHRTRRLASSSTAGVQDNVAFVFVKPHACTQKTLELVPSFLEDKGLSILRSGSVQAEDIDKRGIIDAHYSAIAKVGMAQDIATLALGDSEANKFEKGYGKPLDEAMASGEVCSAVQALEILKVDAAKLLERCLAAGYEKLRSGLYCARLEGGPTGQLFVMNGFYSRMREKFTKPGVVVHWFLVSFTEATLPWKEFRGQVIGATNPADAGNGSLRARIRDDWQTLGLKEETNYQDNGVHASAGPLEALRERQVWLGDEPEADPFGRAIGEKCTAPLSQLLESPVLELADGRTGPAFDLLEDTGTATCIEVLSTAKLQTGAQEP